MDDNMTICYFGIYKPDYSRNRVLIKGLKENGVKVIECNTGLKGISKYFDLIKKHQKIRGKYDAMVVGFPGYQAVILARFLTRKPIIFDAFFSLYDAMVLDRKTVKPRSFKAWYFWLLDWLSCSLADHVLLDTNVQIDFFNKIFNIKKEKFSRIFLGASDDIFYPKTINNKNDIFTVLFYGSSLPLQGVPYIIKAAKLLERSSIEFKLIGKEGKEKSKLIELAKKIKVNNINFIGFLPEDSLLQAIAEADLCLGMFGDTDRAKRVICNKIYECAAMRKSIITADTPAIREFFDKEDLYLVKISDAESLARGILELKNNANLCKKIANNGYNKFVKHGVPKVLGLELKKIIKSVFGNTDTTRIS